MRTTALIPAMLLSKAARMHLRPYQLRSCSPWHPLQSQLQAQRLPRQITISRQDHHRHLHQSGGTMLLSVARPSLPRASLVRAGCLWRSTALTRRASTSLSQGAILPQPHHRHQQGWTTHPSWLLATSKPSRSHLTFGMSLATPTGWVAMPTVPTGSAASAGRVPMRASPARRARSPALRLVRTTGRTLAGATRTCGDAGRTPCTGSAAAAATATSRMSRAPAGWCPRKASAPSSAAPPPPTTGSPSAGGASSVVGPTASMPNADGAARAHTAASRARRERPTAPATAPCASLTAGVACAERVARGRCAPGSGRLLVQAMFCSPPQRGSGCQSCWQKATAPTRPTKQWPDRCPGRGPAPCMPPQIVSASYSELGRPSEGPT